MSPSEPRQSVRRLRGAASGIGAALLAVLVPKCPLCVAAWLTALGVGATGAGLIAPLVRPAALALILVATVLAVVWSVQYEQRSARVTRRGVERASKKSCEGCR
jgi:hypothetical protein